MKKTQAVKFWGELEDNTEIEDVITKFENRTGYASKRTLQRYTQAYHGFKEGIPLEELTLKTGWDGPYLAKLKSWWDEEHSKQKANNPGGGIATDLPPQQDERHQQTLQHMIKHILSWVADFSKPVPLVSSGPPLLMPYGGQTLTAEYPIEEDPAYLALKEHLEVGELWKNFLRYQDLRWQFWGIILPHTFHGSPEWVRREEEILAVLRQDRARVWSELQDSVHRVTHGFRELLLQRHIPGTCQWC